MLVHGSQSSENSQLDASMNPWLEIPEFDLYVRFTTGDRWEKEYNDVLIRTMRLFFPMERTKLVVVLDDEKEEDHELGQQIKKDWPYPRICYSKEGDRSVYHNFGKSRMYHDMFYPEKCTDSAFVGFLDTDTFFTTYVTPDILFENGKPVIIAKIGLSAYPCWDAATELFLGKKEVLQCMSAFPVMVKTKHIIEMREKLAEYHGSNFDELFRDLPIEAGGPFCICQFSIMCNYFWYYHRNEYSWHIQLIPNKVELNFSKLPNSMASAEYYRREIQSDLMKPFPRSSIHLRYLLLNGIKFEQQEPPNEVFEGFIRESLCYAAGFKYCPRKCQMYQETRVHKNIFSFEFSNWLWDKQCIYQQQEHYTRVKELVSYYVARGTTVFGLPSIDKLCSLIDFHEPYAI